MQQKSSVSINENKQYFLITRVAGKTMLIFKQMLFTYFNLHQRWPHNAIFWVTPFTIWKYFTSHSQVPT